MRNGIGELLLENSGLITTVDIEDMWHLIQFRWSSRSPKSSQTVYAQGFVNGQRTTLHREVLRNISAESVDHIDTNGLNNVSRNLRTATQRQQRLNRNIRSDNTTGVNGLGLRKGYWYVSWYESTGKRVSKTFGFGLRHRYTKQEAFSRAKEFRKEIDMRIGCTTGHREV
jgi:hypothetical protein